MGQAHPTSERTAPASVIFRPQRRVRIMPLWALLPSLLLVVTNDVGELNWVLGVVFVVLIALKLLELRFRRVALTPDGLTQHKFFRVRTFTWSALTLHEKDDRIDIRHHRRVLLRMPRRQDKLEEVYEPSLPWDAALEATQSLLEASFPEVAQRRRQVVGELKSARHELGLTHRELAARIGTTPSEVEQVESGDTGVNPLTLRRYASAVGRSLDWQLRDD